MYRDQRTHVYMRPEMYIGSDNQESRHVELYDLKSSNIYNDIISFPEGAERIYTEILNNAVEAILRDKGKKENKINVEMNNNKVSITNYGSVIPIEVHPNHGTYIPELCFGTFTPSNNNRHILPRLNGPGTKGTNIFSKLFSVVICDSNKQLKYSQTWTNNMIDYEQPIIEKYIDDVSFVTVSYEMDFERFGYSTPGGGVYPSEVCCLFAKHAFDMRTKYQIPITFNGHKMY